MAEIVQRTQVELSGPWLLDKFSLEKLDTVLDEEVLRLKELHKADAEKEFRRRQREYERMGYFEGASSEAKKDKLKELRDGILNGYPFNIEDRELEIVTGSQRRFKYKRFSEADLDQECRTAIPVSFTISLSVGKIHGSITVYEHGTRTLRIRVYPGSERTAQLINRLESWAVDNEPSLRERIWLAVAGVHWLIVFSVLFLIWVGIMATRADQLAPLKNEAKALVDSGLEKKNEPRALEVALRLGARHPENYAPAEIPFWYYSLAIALTAVSVVLTFPPKSILGIGKGQRSIKYWRGWSSFVTYTVPVAIFFLGFVLPIIREYWLSLAR